MGRTAFLVMDVQNGIVERYARADALQPIVRALDAARRHGLFVIFVRVAFRPGYPDVSPANRRFATLAAQTDMQETSPTTAVWDGVRPQDHEVVIVKRRVSAFSGSGLALLLRSQLIDHLVLTGIATSGVVLSTVRQAADLDYRLTVLADACIDSDAEVHRVLVEKVFPRQAEVLSVDAWERALETADAAGPA
jgi:nicotinamidase-related amidase